jgi:hypothetical protein
MCISYGEDESEYYDFFVPELLMNIYVSPSSGDNMDFGSYWIGYH